MAGPKGKLAFSGWLLIVIIFFAAIIRFVNLGNVPSGIHGDEAAFGFNALSLLQTGKDEYGKPFPLIFKSFGDYKGAVYTYLTIPFIALFGLNGFSTRLVAALAGLAYVLLTYFLLRKLSQDSYIALSGAAVAAVQPAGIFLSREAEPALLSTVFIMAGVYGVLQYVQKQGLIWWITAVIMFIVAQLSYYSPRLFIAPFLLMLYWLVKNKINLSKKRYVIFAGAATLLFISYVLMTRESGSRFEQVNIFSRSNMQQVIDESIREDGINFVPVFVSRLSHNKLTGLIRYVAREYGRYFSTDFLYFHASQPVRESVPDIGIFHIIDLPFLLIGLYFGIKFGKRWLWFILLWLITAPLVISIAFDESPNIHRFSLAYFPFAAITGYGIAETIRRIHKKLKVGMLLLVIGSYLISVLFYLHQLFIHQPVHNPIYRGYAYNELIQKLPQYYHEYDRIVFTTGNSTPYIYLLFYGFFTPEEYQSMGSPRDLDLANMEKFTFIPTDCPFPNSSFWWKAATESARILFINKGGCNIGDTGRLVDTVKWRGLPEAFQLVEYDATRSAKLKNSQLTL